MNDKIKSIFSVIGIIATISVVFYWAVMKPLKYVSELQHENYELEQKVNELQKKLDAQKNNENEYRIINSYSCAR